MSGARRGDRGEGIANVANDVRTHPRARPHEIQQYVGGKIAVFKMKIIVTPGLGCILCEYGLLRYVRIGSRK